MTQPIRLFVIFSLTVFFITSCRKKDTNPGTPTPVSLDRTQLNGLLAPLRTAPQSFTVTAGAAATLLGADSTIINFYPNSFKDKNGNIITSGTVNIELIEMYKPGDMIANRTSTTTSTGVLVSGGEVSIKATMNGNEVFANKYGLGFKQAAASAVPMGLYYGDANNADSVVNWVRDTTGKTGTSLSGTTYVTRSNMVEVVYYMFDSCSNFKIINCDHPYNSTSALVNIDIAFPDNNFKPDNIQFCIAYPGLNVMTILWALSSTTSPTSNIITYSGYAPVGPNCKFVLVAVINGNFYYYGQDGVVSKNMIVNAPMAPATKDQIKANYKAL